MADGRIGYVNHYAVGLVGFLFPLYLYATKDTSTYKSLVILINGTVTENFISYFRIRYNYRRLLSGVISFSIPYPFVTMTATISSNRKITGG